MPTYEYECDACGHKFEKFQSITAAAINVIEQAIRVFFMFPPVAVSLPAFCSLMVCYRQRVSAVSALVFELSF